MIGDQYRYAYEALDIQLYPEEDEQERILKEKAILEMDLGDLTSDAMKNL
jgi:hypothetical protein